MISIRVLDWMIMVIFRLALIYMPSFLILFKILKSISLIIALF